MKNTNREFPNPADYADDRPELEVQRELHRLGIENDPQPTECKKCGTALAAGGGYAGETILYCPNESCDAGVVWEDCEDAIRRVF